MIENFSQRRTKIQRGEKFHPIEFVQPRSLQLADVLPPRLLTYCDDARYLVSQVIRRTASRDTDCWGLVRLHSDILRRVMYSKTQPAIVRALVDAGVIETANYRVGVRSTGFRIGQRYLGDDIIRVPCRDPRLRDRILADRERVEAEQRSRWLPVYHELDREQRALTITADADAIVDRLDNPRAHLLQSCLVDHLRRQEFTATVSSTGRFFNSASGLKRVLRNQLRLHGEPLGSVDLRNSQPALLAMLLLGKIPPNVPNQLSTSSNPSFPSPSSFFLLFPPPSDVRSFSSLVSGGGLYEWLAVETGLCRETAKRRFLVDCLAKVGNYPSVVEQAVRASFPNVLKAIRSINASDHATLIRTLQRAEAWLVLEQVCPRLLGTVPLFTVHDSIYSPVASVDRVVDAFNEVFDGLKVQFALHVDRPVTKHPCEPEESETAQNVLFQEN